MTRALEKQVAPVNHRNNGLSDELQQWIDKLKNSQKLIIVEGESDKNSLEHFGIRGVVALNNKPIYRFVEDVARITKEVVILTDLDKEGKKLYGVISSSLQKFGVRIDHYFREFLSRRTKLRQLEGLVRYFENSKAY